MIDLYLRADTQAAMDAALIAAGLVIDGNPASGVSIDTIGHITTFDASDPPIATTSPWWCVNIRLMREDFDLSALSAYIITAPDTPYRVWA